jgi:hypothetical protein
MGYFPECPDAHKATECPCMRPLILSGIIALQKSTRLHGPLRAAYKSDDTPGYIVKNTLIYYTRIVNQLQIIIPI